MTSVLFLCLSTVFLSITVHCSSNFAKPRNLRPSNNPRAKVILYEKGITRNDPIGYIYLEEMMGAVFVFGKISGLKPGLHGFHIHQNPDLSNGCIAAGPHYNPFNMDHGGHHSHYRARHVGDLGNVFTEHDGETRVHITDYLISLSKPQDPKFVLGRTIVVHANEDDLGRGMDEGSRTTGNAGGRLACGIIEKLN